ncbi:MAG: xanthine dehydrogenase [Capsulimonas sp.]|nr:xanthine dehydrogenase [Capsulimonas sp.]
MKELQSILAAYREIARDATPAALAMVVKTEGSAYRRAGARMLVRVDGSRVGAISGGCLEADVAERARLVMASGNSQYVRYDARGANGDLLFEAGCDGAIGILIEPIERAAPSLDYLVQCMDIRKSGALATVFQMRGDGKQLLGMRLMMDGGECITDIEDSELIAAIQNDAREVIDDGVRRNCIYETARGGYEVLMESPQTPVALVICGAASGAVPLARLAGQMGWRVTITDPRPDVFDSNSVPDAAFVTAPRERLLNTIVFDSRTAAVVMTHNYEWDLTLLTQMLPSPAGYVGLLGSRRRAQRVWSDLHYARLELTPEQRDRFHSPAGLDIGSETPEEIALSIVAEIQAAMSRRAGGALRDRPGAIHSFETSSAALSEAVSLSLHACAR